MALNLSPLSKAVTLMQDTSLPLLPSEMLQLDLTTSLGPKLYALDARFLQLKNGA